MKKNDIDFYNFSITKSIIDRQIIYCLMIEGHIYAFNDKKELSKFINNLLKNL